MCTLISKQMHRKDVSHLYAILYWPLEDEWGGGAGARMRRDARGQRHGAITAWSTPQRMIENTENTLTCFNRDAAFVFYAGRHDDRSPPSILPKRRLSESGPSPRLQSPRGTAGGRVHREKLRPLYDKQPITLQSCLSTGVPENSLTSVFRLRIQYRFTKMRY